MPSPSQLRRRARRAITIATQLNVLDGHGRMECAHAKTVGLALAAM